MELYFKLFSFLLQCTSIDRCVRQHKVKMKNSFLFYVHTSFSNFYSFLHSPFLISVLTASPSLLSSSTDPHTLLSFSKTHRRSARAQPPLTCRRRPTFDCRPDPFRPLFSIFGISVLCFELCLYFSFVFRVVLVFQLCVSSLLVFRVGFLFRA